MADLIVRSAHIKYQSAMIESRTNCESSILPGHELSEEAKLVFKRVEPVAYRDTRSKELEFGRLGHIQGPGIKNVESTKRGEYDTYVEFCYNLALLEKVLKISWHF